MTVIGFMPRVAPWSNELGARLGPTMALRYADGADPAVDRPAHVRAASAVVPFGDELAIVQDDASFIALVGGDPPREGDAARARSITLPGGEGGRRTFDAGRGNEAHKLDLEAAIVLEGGGGPRLVAFGSGSTRRRESLVVAEVGTEQARIHDGSALYRALRDDPRLSEVELNIEGAIVDGETLRLFQRGNGSSCDDEPANATIDLARADFAAWLDGRGDAPRPLAVARHDLGCERGVPYGFTDAAVVGRDIVFVAVAEDSPDTLRDGAVLGVAIGTWTAGRVVMTRLIEADGAPSTRKVEGIAVEPRLPGGLVVVTDVDDHTRAAEMASLQIVGL